MIDIRDMSKLIWLLATWSNNFHLIIASSQVGYADRWFAAGRFIWWTLWYCIWNIWSKISYSVILINVTVVSVYLWIGWSISMKILVYVPFVLLSQHEIHFLCNFSVGGIPKEILFSLGNGFVDKMEPIVRQLTMMNNFLEWFLVVKFSILPCHFIGAK